VLQKAKVQLFAEAFLARRLQIAGKLRKLNEENPSVL
jgi:hypothetical protein